MKKVFYVANVPWGWIKQRPQFLAEYLSEHMFVDVYYKKSLRATKKILKNSAVTNYNNLKICSYITLPFKNIPILRRIPLEWINKLILRFQLPRLSEYDYVWFTSPSQYGLLKSFVSNNQTVIYDCMDDFAEFPEVKSIPYLVDRTIKQETELLNRCNFVFCSSDYLRNKVCLRSNYDSNRVVIVNNAIELPSVNNDAEVPHTVSEIMNRLKQYKKTLLYIGTIEKWFDYDLMIKVLDQCKEYHLVLIGPSKYQIPKHDRVHHLGVVQHKDIFEIMREATVLVMPFIVNELIKAVNPVKLYEYIYSGRPVIAAKYGETLKFEDYVFLYESESDFVKYITDLDLSHYDDYNKESLEFVQNNTWKARVNHILEHLGNVK